MIKRIFVGKLSYEQIVDAGFVGCGILTLAFIIYNIVLVLLK